VRAASPNRSFRSFLPPLDPCLLRTVHHLRHPFSYSDTLRLLTITPLYSTGPVAPIPLFPDAPAAKELGGAVVMFGLFPQYVFG
jgi:hypothetical protein